MIKLYEKGSDEQLSTHFKAREFDCRCKSCDGTMISDVLVERLEKMRSLLGKPLRITSAYRCGKHQEEIRTSGIKTVAAGRKSTHEEGMAADLFSEGTSGLALEIAARDAGFESVGVASTWIHVDIRPGYRRWSY